VTRQDLTAVPWSVPTIPRLGPISVRAAAADATLDAHEA
jgi:hypothetical protein